MVLYYVMVTAAAHLIHEGLGEGWLIDLIVAVLSVAHNVHHHITLPLLPPLCSQLTRTHHRLDIVTINMEDWGAQGLGYICAVGGAATLLWVGGKSNLHAGVDTSAQEWACCVRQVDLQQLFEEALVRLQCKVMHMKYCAWQKQLMHDG